MVTICQWARLTLACTSSSQKLCSKLTGKLHIAAENRYGEQTVVIIISSEYRSSRNRYQSHRSGRQAMTTTCQIIAPSAGILRSATGQREPGCATLSAITTKGRTDSRTNLTGPVVGQRPGSEKVERMLLAGPAPREARRRQQATSSAGRPCFIDPRVMMSGRHEVELCPPPQPAAHERISGEDDALWCVLEWATEIPG